MAATLQHESGNTYRAEIVGLLSRADLDALQASAAAEILRAGPIRLLFDLERFAGWEPQADWRDLRFYVRHGNDITRMAIVGPERWREEALMFAAAGLRQADVRYFSPAWRTQAIAWLQQ